LYWRKTFFGDPDQTKPKYEGLFDDGHQLDELHSEFDRSWQRRPETNFPGQDLTYDAFPNDVSIQVSIDVSEAKLQKSANSSASEMSNSSELKWQQQYRVADNLDAPGLMPKPLTQWGGDPFPTDVWQNARGSSVQVPEVVDEDIELNSEMVVAENSLISAISLLSQAIPILAMIAMTLLSIIEIVEQDNDRNSMMSKIIQMDNEYNLHVCNSLKK
jgi:hypothetical protein